MLDMKSTLVAGAIGAALYYIVVMYVTPPTGTQDILPTTTILASGFAIGVGVQLGVRMLGVS